MSANRLFNFFILVSLGILVALTVRETYATSLVTSQAQKTESLQRSRRAESARWAAMSEYYAKRQSSAVSNNLERSRKAESARWAAMSEYYAKRQSSAASNNLERSRKAESARWAAMSEYYAKRQSPAASNNLERSLRAESARWAAMSEYYTKLKSADDARQALLAVINAARYTGLTLREYEMTENQNLLPACISVQIMAELPGQIGDNRWKSLVPICSQ